MKSLLHLFLRLDLKALDFFHRCALQVILESWYPNPTPTSHLLLVACRILSLSLSHSLTHTHTHTSFEYQRMRQTQEETPGNCHLLCGPKQEQIEGNSSEDDF